MVSKDHPRYKSIAAREKLVEGYEKGITALAGLIAHGRGEAFDYLLGERTTEPAKRAIEAAAALLLSAKDPVISVNGNTAVLCPRELVELAGTVGAKLEVNLFYRSPEREQAIEKVLLEHGAERVYGVEPTGEISGIASPRAKVDKEGILKADVVLVALEDGDRTEALKKAGKKVIAIDLNPLSRTAQKADITIVDEVTRAVPLITEAVGRMKEAPEIDLVRGDFDNEANLKEAIRIIVSSAV
jgi:4-phosphopantoate--beta-alanine ligase